MFFKSEKKEDIPFIVSLNDYYKSFLLKFSSGVYMLAFLLIVCCAMYYMSYWKQYIQLRRRREALRRANQRLARPHRPYAVYREHEVFRNIMHTVRQHQQRIAERRHIPVEIIQAGEVVICEVMPLDVSNSTININS